jgi:hypothetical protein
MHDDAGGEGDPGESCESKRGVARLHFRVATGC